MNIFKENIIKALKKEIKEDIELEVPPNPEMGDYAFPCFSLAKIYKKNPVEIALKLSKKIKKNKYIQDIKTQGPYLNFFINKSALTEETIKRILKEKDKFGSTNLGKNKKIILEHTSINPNASPHVGRARNALIGDCISRVLKFSGHKVEVHYLVNDIGKQIAMLVLGTRNKKNLTFQNLLKVYMNIAKKVENSPKKEQEVLETLKKLEDRDKKTVSEFKKVVDLALKGQVSILKEIDINYDVFDYESDYLWSKKTNDALDLLKKTGRFYFDKDDRVVLDQKGFELGMKMPVLVLTRSDGTSLYPLRDIAYALDIQTKGEYITILGEDHKLYNQQINVALLLLGKKKRKALYYSFILLNEGKMSTRKGNLVLLEDFIKESVKKSEKELMRRYKKIDKKAAKVIGHGALKYAILKVSPEKNVNFNWEQALSFEGETAPYIQYAYARICSILKKHKKPIQKNINFNLLNTKEEIELVKKLSIFPSLVDKTANELRPNVISNYSYELAKQFNEFYHSHNILKEKDEIKKARLVLASCVKQTLKNSLNLLGIDVLEKM